MSGKSGVGAGVGSVIGGSIGFAVGGPVGAAYGAGIGGGLGSSIGASIDAKDNAKKVKNALSAYDQPIKATPMPTIDNEAVKKARLNTLKSLQQRSGRASTLLTSDDTFG